MGFQMTGNLCGMTVGAHQDSCAQRLLRILSFIANGAQVLCDEFSFLL